MRFCANLRQQGGSKRKIHKHHKNSSTLTHVQLGALKKRRLKLNLKIYCKVQNTQSLLDPDYNQRRDHKSDKTSNNLQTTATVTHHACSIQQQPHNTDTTETDSRSHIRPTTAVTTQTA